MEGVEIKGDFGIKVPVIKKAQKKTKSHEGGGTVSVREGGFRKHV